MARSDKPQTRRSICKFHVQQRTHIWKILGTLGTGQEEDNLVKE